MTGEEWDPIAARLGAAWPIPEMDAERRAVYLDVLGDLAEADVRAAADALLREDREQLPPPGVIRIRAIDVAKALTATAPDPPPAPKTQPTSVTVPGVGVMPVQPSGPFNHRAFWGLMAGLTAILGPLTVRAALITADPAADPSYFPIETTILAGVAIFLAIAGWRWAKEEGAGRKLPIAALVVAGLACLFALGAFGATADSAEQ